MKRGGKFSTETRAGIYSELPKITRPLKGFKGPFRGGCGKGIVNVYADKGKAMNRNGSSLST